MMSLLNALQNQEQKMKKYSRIMI